MDIIPVLVWSLLLGLCLGSFFNVVVWRLYAMEPLGGRSRCPSCRNTLKPIDLIPLVSFHLLGGECRYCKKPISWQYPLFEALTGVAFLAIAWKQWVMLGDTLATPYGIAQTAFQCFVASVLIVTIASDAKYNLIYDIVVIPSIMLSFVARLALGGSLLDIIFGIIVGLLFFGSQYVASDGRWIGFGDVKLAVFLGIVFGWKGLLFLIAIAYIIGSIASIAWLIRRQKTMKSTLPLGVFLGIAGLYILLYGTRHLERLMHV